MRNPFRRKAPGEPPVTRHAVVIEKIPPVEVKHTIERKAPPRPTMITFSVHDDEGRRFSLPPMDLSYRHGAPVQFPLAWVSGNPADNQRVEIYAELHYDPRDQR